MKIKNLALLLCAFVSSVCSVKAAVVTETRRVDSFQEIRVELGIDVYFTQENSKTIEIEADEEMIKKITTDVEDDALIISREKDKSVFHIVKKNKAIKVYVSSSMLSEITLSDGSDFYADNLNCRTSFQATASGGSDIHITSLTVSGNTTISSSGASDCAIESLQSRNCFLSAIGGSDMKIDLSLTGNLFVTASEGSSVHVSGNANYASATASENSDIDVQNLTSRNISVNTSGNSNVRQ
ncbi:MAG: DUF2807 domain-containing protein [Candidatus Azobacteroides sp.]|nr:DUF2807 domain-containing protein [Candidatus Azobacteroides sp.]